MKTKILFIAIFVLSVALLSGCSKKYTVTFNTNGGSPVSALEVKKGQKVEKPTNPTKEGYEFVGWYKDNQVYDFDEKVTEDFELVAKWNVTTYTITYVNDGSTVLNPTSYNIETETFTLTSPTKEGYKFEGWYNGEEKIEQIAKGTAGNLELVAKWNVTTYTITYVNDGSTVLNPTSYNIETETFTLTSPTKEGYKFIGWYNGEEKVEQILKGTTGNLELVAKYTIKEINVSFDTNGGSSVENQTVLYGEQLKVLPMDPNKDGYKFEGWYLDVELTNKFDSKNYAFTNNITLYAKWNLENYLITYQNDGSNVLNPTSYNIETETITLLNPQKNNYEFEGWYNGEEKVEQILKGTTGNLELVAKWKLINATITFDTQGGTTVDSIIGLVGSKINKPNSPEKEGYEFEGWYLNDEEYQLEVFPNVETTTLVAKWKVLSYKLTLMDGDNIIYNEQVEYGTDLSKFSQTKDDYKFLGWLDENNDLIKFNTMPAKALTLIASWEFSYTIYTISYDLDGGNWPKDVPYQTRTEMVEDFIKDINDFFGVSVTASNFMDGSYNFSSPVESFFKSTEYQAKWSWLKTYIIETCKTGGYSGLTYLTNESDEYHNTYLRANLHAFLNATVKSSWPASYDFSSETASNGYYDYLPGETIKYPTSYTYVSETLTIPTPKKDSYQFVGWFDEKGIEVTEIPNGSRGNITLYARWTVIEYSITYVLNGGDEDGLIINYFSNLSSKLYLTYPTKEGYAFLGFYENSDYTGMEVLYIEPGSKKDYLLYAKWTKEQLGSHKTISFYGDSISTFENYVPSDATFYYPVYSSTVKQVELTWWKKVMEQTGTTFHTNISYSGSTVKGTNSTCGENQTRINKIAKNGIAPDILIVYLGINDCVSGYTANEFKISYQNMLTKMKTTYPNTDIFICTLPYETYTDGSNPDGKNYPGLRESYNEVIKAMATEFKIGLIDIEPCITSDTESMESRTYLGDNIHPNASGMQVIANKVTEELKKYYVE